MRARRAASVAVVARIAVATVFVSLCASAAPQSPLSAFSPPATEQEQEMWKSVANDKKASDAFVATRIFMRRLTVYAADLPKGVTYEPKLHGCPTLPGNVDFKYILNDEEGRTLYRVRLECMLKESGSSSKCGQERIPPAVVAAARPAAPQPAPDAALAQLVPPATPEELKLFEQAKKDGELRQFVATRLYMRQIVKLAAAVPAGQKFDPASAPKVPSDVSFTYLIDDNETKLLYRIKLAQ
jgi:hypothetical protein